MIINYYRIIKSNKVKYIQVPPRVRKASEKIRGFSVFIGASQVLTGDRGSSKKVLEEKIIVYFASMNEQELNSLMLPEGMLDPNPTQT